LYTNITVVQAHHPVITLSTPLSLFVAQSLCSTGMANNNSNDENTPILGMASGASPVRAIEEGDDIVIEADWSRTLKVYGGLRIFSAIVVLVAAGMAIGKGYDYPCSSPLRGFLVFYLVMSIVELVYTLFIMTSKSDNLLLIHKQRFASTMVSLILALAFTIFAYKDDADCNAHVIWGSRIIAPWALATVLLKMVMMEFIFNDNEM